MEQNQTAFQIHLTDNVATALCPLSAGQVALLGDRSTDTVLAMEEIPKGHKIALREIQPEEEIIKYGVVIGKASVRIPAGSWVHLHVMHSVYDERSGHLDAVTGAPKDTVYE